MVSESLSQLKAPTGHISSRVSSISYRPFLRFGSADTHITMAALPEWTKRVKDPPITLPLLMEKAQAFEKQLNSPKPPGFFSKVWQGFKLARSGRMLYRELTRESRYLPTAAQKALTRYHWTPGYWKDRFFNPKQAKLMDVVYQGPMAIKAKQQAVSLLPLLRQSIKVMEVEGDKQTGILKFILNMPVRMANKKIREVEIYSSLLNHVPALPYAQFEKQLNEVKTLYNKEHRKDPIISIQKEPIGTGSMGQVYQAKTQTGKKLVLKVIRSNLDEAYLNEYLPYSYYRVMLLKGTSPQSKHQAVQSAQNTVNLLKAEIRPEQEAVNIRFMRYWAEKLRPSTFQIPEVLAVSKRGMIMPYMGEKDLADVSPSEQATVKNKLAPELARFLMLASAKSLDLHNGNIRIGQPAAWIDHGRQINLNERNHQMLLQLMFSAYKAPKIHPALSVWENALLQPDVRGNLKTLLEISAKSNHQALQKLANLEKMQNLSAAVVHQAELQKQLSKSQLENLSFSETEAEKKLQQQLAEARQTLQPFNETKTLLTQLLGQPNLAVPKAQLSFFHTKRSLPEPEVQPSALYAWASSAMNLPGFMPSKLPQLDVTQYKHKSHGFLVPYLQALTQAETDKKLKKLADELVEALITQCGKAVTEQEKANLSEVMISALKQDLPVKVTVKQNPLPK